MEVIDQEIKPEVEEIPKDHNGKYIYFKKNIYKFFFYFHFSFYDRLVQQRVEEGDRIRKMKPEERLKLLKKTLKKSTALTERLLQRLDREWDDIYQEDSENGTYVRIFSDDL